MRHGARYDDGIPEREPTREESEAAELWLISEKYRLGDCPPKEVRRRSAELQQIRLATIPLATERVQRELLDEPDYEKPKRGGYFREMRHRTPRPRKLRPGVFALERPEWGIFRSANAAAAKAGCSSSNIRNSIKTGQSAGGLHWNRELRISPAPTNRRRRRNLVIEVIDTRYNIRPTRRFNGWPAAASAMRASVGTLWAAEQRGGLFRRIYRIVAREESVGASACASADAASAAGLSSIIAAEAA